MATATWRSSQDQTMILIDAAIVLDEYRRMPLADSEHAAGIADAISSARTAQSQYEFDAAIETLQSWMES